MPSGGLETKPLKLVLDTNILLSALVFSGKLGFIEDLIERRIVAPCFIESTFREFQNTLEYSKFTTALAKLDTSPEQILHALAEHSQVLSDPKEIPNLAPGVGDNYILAAATAANVNTIVTGDNQKISKSFFQRTKPKLTYHPPPYVKKVDSQGVAKCVCDVPDCPI